MCRLVVRAVVRHVIPEQAARNGRHEVVRFLSSSFFFGLLEFLFYSVDVGTLV